MGSAVDNGGEGAANQRTDLDFAGFAQEFLRRNPDYAQDYRAVGSASLDEQEVMARRWGLCFPGPAQRISGRGARILARHPVPRHRHSRCGAIRVR
jgi:hypothetical protein